ncbi:MAG: M48 family metalloprotease [Pseudomonadales bacterium]
MWLALLLLTGYGHAAGPGEKLYREFVEKEQIYPDQAWQDYVTEVGQRLLAQSPDAGDKYYFYVLDNSAVNAMALPDGYVFVNRGLIAYLRSEDELAGVIGHEIGHVVKHHAARSNSVRRWGDIAGFVGAVLTGTGAIADLSSTAAATMASGYGREFELESDQFGGEVLAKSGYNPLAMIDVLHVLKDQQLFAKNVQKQPVAYHGLFSTHPNNDKRLHEAVQQSQHLFPDQLREPERDFWEMVDGLVFGDEAATGLIKDHTYYHSALRVVIDFPAGWDVTNTPAEVVGRDRAGAQHSFISVQRLNQASEKQNPQEFITKTLKRDDVSEGELTEINGYPAFVGKVAVASGNAQDRRIAVIYKDNSVYLFRGEVGPIGDVTAFDPQWRETLNSFRAMTADDLKVANNQRIKVIVARPGDTYAELAQRSSIKSYAEETLRLINGQHPVGEPRAGDYIKIVQ